MLKILAVGDVFGEYAVGFCEKYLRVIKNRVGADTVIVNAENATGGSGLDKSTAEMLLDSGADVLTGGNHSFSNYRIFDFIDDYPQVLRPLNFPSAEPGCGYVIVPTKGGLRVMVISVCGQVFMDPVDSPFAACERLLEREKGNYDLAVCDFHAEATSEKLAFSHHFDGRISIVFGTHTHVQTADERLTPRGGGYITDLGMTGSQSSIIGVSYESAVPRYTRNIRMKKKIAAEDLALCGALFTVDEKTLYCTDVQRIKFYKDDLK